MTASESQREVRVAESDRRVATRHLACFPVHVENDEARRRTAVIRDLSVTGARLLTRAHFQVGDRLTLSLYLSSDVAEARVVQGRVVRAEKRSYEEAQVWPHSVAVQFDEPLLDAEMEIRRIAAQQADLGVAPT